MLKKLRIYELITVVCICFAAGLALAACNEAGAEAPGEDVALNEDEGPHLIEEIFRPDTIEVQVPEGTKMDIRLTTDLSSAESQPGDPVEGRIAEAVLVDERVVIPSGSTVLGRVTEVRALSKIGGRSELAFEFDTLTLPDGQEKPVRLVFARTGNNETAKDAATIAGSTIIGAVIGHQIDGDGDGRAVGAVAGAGVGTAIAVETKGETIVLPSGTMLRLTSQIPITVEVRKQ